MTVSKSYYCVNCGKRIHKCTALYGTKLCQRCYFNKIKKSLNYCCEECGDLICVQTALRGSGLCCKCALKYRKTNKGIRLSEETKNKISKANKGKFIGKNSVLWKGGKPKCLDCGKQLKWYNLKRCWDCYKKWAKCHQITLGLENLHLTVNIYFIEMLGII